MKLKPVVQIAAIILVMLYLMGCHKKSSIKKDPSKPSEVQNPVVQNPEPIILPKPVIPSEPVVPPTPSIPSTPGTSPVEGKVLRMRPTIIHFGFDKSLLTPEAKTELQKLVHNLKANPHSTYNVVIEGHCDQRGSVEYNYKLGKARAISARLYLIKHGYHSDNVSTVSYGKDRPMDHRQNEQAWARNRRAVINTTFTKN